MLSKDYSWKDLITQIVKDVIKRSKPTGFFLATVESISPLKIRRDQKFVLDSSVLLITDSVKDTEKEITINGQKQAATIHNSLKVGDKVLVLQNNGGQEFVILERVSSA